MRMPRVSIAWVMVAVAIAALDFGAIRAHLDPQSDTAGLVFGALPMANVLLVGLLTAPYRPRSRSYLLGFEAFGAIALALYIFLLSTDRGQEWSISSYIDFVTIIVINLI
jgi:small basic protein